MTFEEQQRRENLLRRAAAAFGPVRTERVWAAESARLISAAAELSLLLTELADGVRVNEFELQRAVNRVEFGLLSGRVALARLVTMLDDQLGMSFGVNAGSVILEGVGVEGMLETLSAKTGEQERRKERHRPAPEDPDAAVTKHELLELIAVLHAQQHPDDEPLNEKGEADAGNETRSV